MINWQNLPNTTTPVNATNLNATNAEIDKRYNLEQGQILTNETDLNTLTTIGSYYSNSATITNSLVNCPIKDAGFKLIVEYTTASNRIVQTIKVNNASTSATYIRTYTGSWGEWIKTSNGAELYSIDTGSTSNITLNKNISVYSEIEIIYDVSGYKKSVKLKTDGNSSIRGVLDCIYVGSQNMVIGSQVITLSGTTLTRGNSAGKNINLNTNAITDNSNLTFTIYKVVGY